jgi:hypothetical protein
MNNHIQEFKLQAGIQDHLDQEGLDLFADLIIKECVDICFNLRFTIEGPSDTASYQRTLCGTAIKEHFGLQSKGPISAKSVL